MTEITLEEAMEKIVEHCREGEGLYKIGTSSGDFCPLLPGETRLGECDYLDKSNGVFLTGKDKKNWQAYKIYKCTYKEKHPCSDCTCKADE